MNDVKRLVEPLIPALRRYAGALLRDGDAADDLVQDCLERAISRWGQRRADGDTRTWLFAILHNLAMSRLRREARRGAHLTLESADETALSQAPDQEHRLRHGELLRAVAALPEDQRSVLLLVSVEDLSYAETARVLGAPVGTVMSRLSRARERLRQAMMGESAPVARAHLRRVK
ncbi:MAG TPA: sigma-70 family RNA polymerase sigma factor [Caulobacteraceae bacterium]|nr:sigma-70 family RNA polymerase sigma factor [Caulobacteraceae bacterium]